ncbi:hypothetical protein SZN_35347 [Streptomyces zinciresistens K42]|uniref:Uncharacterized protein n=1 Tax=Streptomyces zinciresistens K42 TaxID=700597 RepID=G2GNG4_9ACTN|nr:hypothetical protein [Streptomyces zinciresistens]EGX54947.1 hypothetical protein SZN_35347 [Streptomyces zinciresistens K42]
MPSTDNDPGRLPRLVIDDSARDTTAKLWYALPDGFLDVPLQALDPAPGSAYEEQFTNVLALILDSAPEDQRERYAGALRDMRFMVGQMRGEGVIGCSLGLHFADDGSSVTSVVTVALRDIEWAPPKLTAVRAAAARESAGGVELLALPGGRPGSMCDTLVTVPAVAGLPAQELYQCDVYVPAPSGAQLAVLALSTTAVSARGHYRDLMKAVAHTVAFHDPLPDIERTVRGDGPGGIKDSVTADFG